MGQIKYYFEELPLFISESGAECALISGTAIIDYENRDSSWSVDRIMLDGWSAGKPMQSVDLPWKDNQWLFFAISDRLEHAPFENHILAKIDDDRGCSADQEADYRYELMRERRMEQDR